MTSEGTEDFVYFIDETPTGIVLTLCSTTKVAVIFDLSVPGSCYG